MPRTIMGLETRACINGLNKTDFENVKKIPTLESETNEIKNETIPSLDERVTALEQGGSGGKEYEWVKINFNTILDYLEYDENENAYFIKTDMILKTEFLTGEIDYDNLTRPYYFNNYQYRFFKNEYFTEYYSGLTPEEELDYIKSMMLFYYGRDIPISLPKQDSGLKAIGVVNTSSEPHLNSQTNYYEQLIHGYIIINDTNPTFKEITGKIVFEEFSIYAYKERK